MRAHKWHFLVFGILIYVVALVVTFPANRAYGWIRPTLGSNIPVQLYGVNGTVWSGTASQAQLFDYAVNDLHWRLHPLALLLGSLEVALDAPLSGGRATGTLIRPLTGQGLSIETPHIDLPLATLLDANRFPTPIAGRLTGDLTRVDITDSGEFQVDTGDLLIRDLTVQALGQLALGEFKVRIEHDTKGALLIKTTDTGGPLKLNATVTFANNDRYMLIAELSARNNRDAVLMQTLRMLGAPDRTGTYRIQRQGSIKQDLALLGG